MTIKARGILTSLRWNATDVNALDITRMNFIPDSRRRKEINPTEKREEETLLMSFHARKVADQGVWVVDSGCSNHMTGYKEFFSTRDENFRTTVCLDNNATVQVMGKGTVDIKTRNGFVESISNVFYIPDLKANLFSISQLQEKGL